MKIIEGTIRQIKADEGKYIRRKGDTDYYTACILLSNETESDFDEVDTIDSEELKQAKSDKIDDITAYDSSDSVNSFSYKGINMWLDKETRGGLLVRFNAEKAAGKLETTLWNGTNSISLSIDEGIQMLYALEVYASECYDNTARHKANVTALSSVEDVANYDYKQGYPNKLEL